MEREREENGEREVSPILREERRERNKEKRCARRVKEKKMGHAERREGNREKKKMKTK